MATIWFAIAKSVMIESVRRKEIWVVVILAFLIVSASSMLGFFGFAGLSVFAKDLAGTVLGIMATILAIVTSARLMPDEIKNRTLYPLLSRPMSRFDLIVGKFLGSVIVSWIAFLALCTVVAVSLLFFGVQFEPIMIQYVFAKMIGLAVVCAVTLMFSLVMTQAAAVTMSFVLAFGSSMIIRAMTMSYESAGPVQPLFVIINSMLPQYGLFDLSGRATTSGWGPVPMWVLGALLCYGAVYSVSMLALGWLKFRNRAV